MGNLNEFFRDLGRNAYGLGENVASLGSAAIAEPVAGFAAMYDPANGAQAIREGMTYTPRTQAGQMYQQGAARTLGTIAKPATPVIDTWQRGVDIAGGYSPVAGAMLRTVPAAIGVAMGAKPALQAGRQASESLGAMQGRMIANANAPRTLNTGFMGQRGAIGTQRPLTEFEQAHLTAQRNAALPVSQGGLGLAPDNTAMDRARAMGFDVDNPVYHGTKANINSFDNSRLGQATNAQSAKKAHFFSDSHNNSDYYSIRQAISREFDKSLELEKKYRELDAEWEQLDKLGASDDVLNDVEQKINKAKKEWRQEYDATRDRLTKEEGKSGVMNDYTTGANVLPVLVNKGDSLVFDQLGGRRSTTFSELLDDVIKTKKDSLVVNNTFDPYESTVTAIVDPKNIRSRFAAFDPMQRQSSNLLAQSANFAPAATLGALMANEKRKDKRN